MCGPHPWVRWPGGAGAQPCALFVWCACVCVCVCLALCLCGVRVCVSVYVLRSVCVVCMCACVCVCLALCLCGVRGVPVYVSACLLMRACMHACVCWGTVTCSLPSRASATECAGGACLCKIESAYVCYDNLGAREADGHYSRRGGRRQK